MVYRVEPPHGTTVELSEVPLGEWYPFFMQWQVPVFASVAYFCLAYIFNPKSSKLSRMEAKRNNVQVEGKAATKKPLTPMTIFIVMHNLFLAAYSLWAFKSVFPAFVGRIMEVGMVNAMCDLDGTMWNSVVFVHGYLFYVSKFYELIDTLIIILKGRRASFLQIYHHAGVIVVMYYGNYFCSSALVFIVWENAGVHTIMYTYYVFTALGINPPGKQYLTSLQIFQFLFGQAFIVVYLLLSDCQTPDQRKWLWITNAYLLPLIYLFVQFFIKTYKGRSGKPNATKKIE